MKLTDTAIRNVKPSGRPKKMSDGGGLYFEISPKGDKYWRQIYRFQGKEKKLAHGVYPDVSLKMARDRSDEAKRLHADSIDPGAHKKVQEETEEKTRNIFEALAREWHQKQTHVWTDRHTHYVLKRL